MTLSEHNRIQLIQLQGLKGIAYSEIVDSLAKRGAVNPFV
jgi:hypothetical protein